MIVTALREIVQGRRPLLQLETAERPWAHCRSQNKNPDYLLQDVLREEFRVQIRKARGYMLRMGSKHLPAGKLQVLEFAAERSHFHVHISGLLNWELFIRQSAQRTCT